MYRFLSIVVFLLIAGAPAAAQDDGLLRKPSAYPVDETVRRFAGAVEDRGLKVFVVIDHGGAAAEAGAALLPMKVVVFGHPKSGSVAMANAPTIGIDLPMKALVYEDADGAVWLAYNSADYFHNTIMARHGLSAAPEQTERVATMLEALTDAAVR